MTIVSFMVLRWGLCSYVMANSPYLIAGSIEVPIYKTLYSTSVSKQKSFEVAVNISVFRDVIKLNVGRAARADQHEYVKQWRARRALRSRQRWIFFKVGANTFG
jgi:hypothetical protein